jgi:aminoglycoside phosphotransferase (APT) family kinase protein
VALGLESVAGWSGIELVEPLTGGARNPVVLARRGGQRLVVRRSARSLPALEWELDVLEHLAGHGVGVPRVVATDDGRRHADGVLVHEFIDGTQPRDSRDWQRVIEVLTRVHELTVGWPQRPGFASTRQLLVTERGGDVRLDTMPPEAVHAVRGAWRPALTGLECVNHGDVGAGNVLVDGVQVFLLDWDEARTDVPWFDFAFMPDDVDFPAPVDRQTLVTAGVAWEAATCWVPEPEYAARRLAELYSRSG